MLGPVQRMGQPPVNNKMAPFGTTFMCPNSSRIIILQSSLTGNENVGQKFSALANIRTQHLHFESQLPCSYPFIPFSPFSSPSLFSQPLSTSLYLSFGLALFLFPRIIFCRSYYNYINCQVHICLFFFVMDTSVTVIIMTRKWMP
jgi:hypothetical protein